MRLEQFIENRFQELTLETQQQQIYSLSKDAEIKALHQLLSSMRTLIKWALIPKIFFQFIEMKLGCFPEPQPALMNKIKADQETEKAAKAAKDFKLKAVSEPTAHLHDACPNPPSTA